MPEEIVTARIVFDKGGLAGLGQAGAIPTAGGAGGGGLGGLPFSGGTKGGAGLAGAAGLGAVAGAVAAGVMMIASTLKKLLGAVTKASPRLQASMTILKKAFEMLLRPIGDILSMFVRPMAIALLKFAIPLYKKWREWMENNNIAETLRSWFVKEEGERVEEGAVAGGAPTALVTGGQVLWSALEGLWGRFKILAAMVILVSRGVMFLIKGLLFLLEKAFDPLMPVLEFITDLFIASMSSLNDLGSALFGCSFFS